MYLSLYLTAEFFHKSAKHSIKKLPGKRKALWNKRVNNIFVALHKSFEAFALCFVLESGKFSTRNSK
jgi:hypothetical protein